MFGQTIKSNGGGRGRKKGFELPGHKWVKRIPNGKGGWRYIYDKAVGGATYANRVAKAGVDRAFNSRVPNYAHVLRLNPLTDVYRKGFEKGGKAITRQLKKPWKAGKLDYNSDGKVNFGDARDYAGDTVKKIGKRARKIGKKIRGAYDRFESSTNNRPDVGDISRNAKKMLNGMRSVNKSAMRYHKKRVNRLRKNIKKKINAIF